MYYGISVACAPSHAQKKNQIQGPSSLSYPPPPPPCNVRCGNEAMRREDKKVDTHWDALSNSSDTQNIAGGGGGDRAQNSPQWWI